MRVRQYLRRTLVVFCGLFVVACPPEEAEPITPGRYEPLSGNEWIVVTPNTIDFHVNFHVDEPDRLTDKETEYWLESDGQIMFSMTSGELFTGVAWYKWYWRDGKIAKIDRDTKQIIWFVKTEE